jgi:hypothetical protein
MSDLGKYAKALLGLAIFAGCILAIRTSGLLEASIAPNVQAGNVSSVDATWFLTVAESVLSFAFTWGVFAFGRLGEGGIAFVKALLGFKPAAPAKANGEAVIDFNAEMRELYAALVTKRNSAVNQADSDIQKAIHQVIKETKEKVTK